REFFAMLAGAITGPRGLCAQQKAMPVIGILAAASPDNAGAQRMLAAFRKGLGESGYVEGQTVAIEYRWAEGRFDRLPALAADLVGRKVDLIVTEGGDPSVLAAKEATSTIPVVFHTNRDPVASGLIASLARPGGNLTGVSLHGLAAKRIELLSELVPQARGIALLVNPNDPFAGDEIRDAQEAARTKGVQLRVVKAGNDSEIEPAFAGLRELGAGALVVVGNPTFSRRMAQIVALASRNAIPAIYSGRLYVETGGLLSYSSNLGEVYRLKGIYTGKILKGAKPADLPVERPSRFELVINLKTAEALELTIPPLLLAQADEVVE
ncbi:MAG TPA: ABC transporter substrate-binding protein, partial [Stellaceae bacterium]|nr:ABC transporter substrate-binding protein [Stellaceae bacterium]